MCNTSMQLCVEVLFLGGKMSRRLDDLNLNGIKIYQETDYFCFGIDSVLIANFINSNSSKNNIIDLCSGSGVISIIMSQKIKSNKIFAVELQNEMFELLDINIKYNNLEDKIYGINCNINDLQYIKVQLNQKIGIDKVDIIVSNPPYKEVGTGITNENSIKYIARHEEKCKLEDIFNVSSNLLKSKGKLYIVHKPERLPDLFELARKYKLEPKKLRFVHPYKDKAPSIVLIEYVKDGGRELKILDPLIEYKDDGSYTDEINEIYGKKNNY